MDASQFFLTYIVSTCLFSIMVGLGLNLSLQDILRVVVMPKAVLTGLAGQIILLPLLAFAYGYGFGLAPVIAIGLVILAACPGGITSNAYVFASRGDIALSVTLTSVASLLSVVTIPLLIWLGLAAFAESTNIVTIPLNDMVASLAKLTVLPIIIGMTLRHLRPGWAETLREPVRKLAVILLLIVIIGNSWFSLDTIKEYFVQAGAMAILLNLSCMLMGFGLSKLMRLNGEQTISITYEVGLQNIALALTLANTILMVPDYAIFSILYGFLMKFSALGFMAYSKKLREDKDKTTAPESSM